MGSRHAGALILEALLLASSLACESPAHVAAQTEHVSLRATNPAGVPLHPQERAREMSGRLPDGAIVEVLSWGAGRRWLEVRTRDGVRGWIVRRYVAREGASVSRAPPPPDAFRSLAECEAVLAEREPRTSRGPRIASWNVRWFPDGSSHGPSDSATDVEHLACVLATLDVDAVALQEIMLHERGLRATSRLLAALDRRTGGRWRAHFDECPRDGRQHVGWLVDEERVRAGSPVQIDALNSAGACAHHLRPGLALRLDFDGGPDLFVISAHLDSGVEGHDYASRQRSFAALGAAIAALRPADDDALLIGDLNTMGRRAPRVSPEEELRELDATLASESPRLRRVPAALACTEYYRGRGSLLDHVIVTASMAELPAGRRVEVHGPCARYRCRLPRGLRSPSLEHLSDHCPIVVELDPVDRD